MSILDASQPAMTHRERFRRLMRLIAWTWTDFISRPTQVADPCRIPPQWASMIHQAQAPKRRMSRISGRSVKSVYSGWPPSARR